MNDRLGIVHVVVSLDVGGLERVVLDLIAEANRRGDRSTVLCLERPGALARRAEGLGAEVITIGKRPGLRPTIIPLIARDLVRLAPDVVHTHQIGALLYAGPAARRARVPAVIHTEHIDNVAKAASLGRKLRVRLLWGLAGRYAARFCCVSHDIGRAVVRLGAIPRRKVVVVPNGVNTQSYLGADAAAVRSRFGIPRTAPVVGSVGRLAEVKRQDLLIRGFARVVERHPDAHLLLVGDGPELGPLRDLAGSLDLADRVHLAGYQAEPQQFLAAMNVFALTSRMEGMPLVILEAWSAGIPVVATAVGGVPDLVSTGHDALTIESGNVVGLAEALDRILADRELSARLGEAGRLRASREFDSEVMANAYAKVYREVLAGARSKVRGVTLP